MAKVQCPLNVSSITLATSGVLTPDHEGYIECTPTEATILCRQGARNHSLKGCLNKIHVESSGALSIAVPLIINKINIAGIPYTANGAITGFGQLLNTPVGAVAATQFLYQNFHLIHG
jgi:hypothetical protein